ncbi:MAG: type III-B CRISPR-associated protein Cas10/Cmr2, partial [Burkholderiaceae bacterium]|nr:type III-B CRISPR-associated protein Cas10/Cmr2 [Burkholderiaceae bacterium]
MLAARLHDPPEKALVLMRTPEGHEGGTSRELARELFENGVPEAARAAAARADQWASAADRAAFPRARDDGRFPAWQQVRFHDRPVIIHPLTGREFDLISLFDVDPAHAKAVSIDHLRGLVHSGDLRRTALAFWRFGPEIGADELRSLWRLLPADTRVPDHTIWDHLDLTAAFAAAFASDPDGGPALLSVSLGPVQDFIAASRSTSDLWAGSHLLARLSWEAMRVVCEELGPESILFPRLRGVPQVDLWLRDKCGLDHRLFEKLDWSRVRSDANPLFAAALPNRFTALVPASAVHAIAEKITVRVRSWARDAAKNAFREVLDIARMDDDPEYPAYAQIAAQFEGFPEIHWAAVPWSLVGTDGSGRVLASDRTLADAMQPYFESTPPGYLATPAWLALAGEIELEQGWFWKPNPGALYPALHELLDRVLAATKATRPFPQLPQQGWRCSLTGETEWLTTNRDQLGQSFRTQTDTVWAKASQQRPTLIRPGEHLGAQATLKRMWPRIFTRELGAVADIDAKRFVVSTHALALSATLERWINSGRRLPETFAAEVRNPSSAGERVLLPKKLSHLIAGHPEKDTLFAIPGWLEKRVAAGDDASAEDARGRLAAALGSRIEAYYGLLLFDGDRMGAWLSADRSLTLS